MERWRESTQVRAQVKTTIDDTLIYLPFESYSQNEVAERADVVYQHIFTNYPGGGRSVYAVWDRTEGLIDDYDKQYS